MYILIHWKEEYSLNIKEIDQQHKKLIDIINVLYDSFIRKEDDNILEQTIENMLDYTFIHFKNEEKYFAQFGYEEAATHIAEHKFFLKRVEKFRAEYRSDNPALTQKVMTFLQEWFTNHIMVSDKKYIQSFMKGGVK